jgi:hypothetical protein
VHGGFDHYEAWRCYGPYLTIQLAHCFLLIGDLEKMDALLAWTYQAGFSRVNTGRFHPDAWQVVNGAWNEQHCYPIADNYRGDIQWPAWWYMGDIPHGWACAEFMTLMRAILFFEADEDHQPHIYIGPGLMPHWFTQGSDKEIVRVSDADTIFGHKFGYTLEVQKMPTDHKVVLTITQPVEGVSYILVCRFGTVQSVQIEGILWQDFSEHAVRIPAISAQAAGQRIVIELTNTNYN